MLKNKLIYLALIVASCVFFILYRDRLALILFLSVLVITFFLFLSALIMRICVRISVECKQKVVFSENKVVVNVGINNYSFLPITQVLINAQYKNNLLSNSDKGKISFFANPFSKNKYEVELTSKHYGNVEVYFKDAKITDYFGVFSFKVKINKSFTLSFMPKRYEIDASLRQNMYTLSEATTYSKYKPGDDPSEIFAIRDYIDGDKLNRIHWKLSSKQEKFMVKDYSLPISEAVLLYPELVFEKEEDIFLIDSVLEVLFSLSNTFIENNTIHYVAWYNSDVKAISVQKVENIDDLYTVMGAIFSNEYYSEPKVMNMDDDNIRDMSHFVYISPNFTSEYCESINRLGGGATLCTAINVVKNNESVQQIIAEDLNIITVTENKVFDSLNGSEI